MKNKGAYIYNLYFDIFILYPSSTIDDQQSILHLTKNIQQKNGIFAQWTGVIILHTQTMHYC